VHPFGPCRTPYRENPRRAYNTDGGLIAPMNFANIRESSVRSIEARCEARGHEAVVNCDALPADLPVSTYRSTAALAVIWTGGAVADLYSPLSTMQNWIISPALLDPGEPPFSGTFT
jgi:hypothetical protein